MDRFANVLDQAMTIIRNCVPPKLSEIVRVMKPKKDNSGVVFDVWEDKVDSFLAYSEDYKEKNGGQFELTRCLNLPELEEEDDEGGAQSGWRGGNEYGGKGFNSKYQGNNNNGYS